MLKERNYSFDFVKGIGILAIIFLHTAAFSQSSIEFNGISLYRILNVTYRFAVPFFFMVSAYFFYEKYIEDKSYIKKYLIKILKPTILWYFIYFLFDFLLTKRFFGIMLPYLPQSTLKTRIINGFTMGTITLSSYHLWYLWATIIITITLMVYFKFSNNLIKLFIVALILNLIGLFGTWQGLNYLVPQSSIFKTFFTREAFFFGLLYFTSGMIIKKYEHILFFNKKSHIYLIFFMLFTFTSILESIMYSNLSGTVVLADFYVSTIPMAFSLFLFCKNYKGFSANNIIVMVGKDSLYYYASHIILAHSLFFISFKPDMTKLVNNLMIPIGIYLILIVIIMPFSRKKYNLTFERNYN